MTDQTPNPVCCDDDTGDTSPETLLIDLAHIHLRTMSPPMPKHPGAMGWQMMTASMSALAARLLHTVQQVAPGQAAEIAEWFHGPFGDGPDLIDAFEWFDVNVARPAGADYGAWIRDARQRAEEAQQAAVTVTKEN